MMVGKDKGGGGLKRRGVVTKDRRQALGEMFHPLSEGHVASQIIR